MVNFIKKNECEHEFLPLLEGLTYYCKKCVIVEVDGIIQSPEFSTEVFFRYITEEHPNSLSTVLKYF